MDALAEIESTFGTIVCRAVVSDHQRAGLLFVPLHWTDQLSSRGRVGALVAAITDPISGQLDFGPAPTRGKRAYCRQEQQDAI